MPKTTTAAAGARQTPGRASAKARPVDAQTAPAGGYMAVDFGTSNSAVAVQVGAAGPGGGAAAPVALSLVELEPGHPTMPTAVFYRADTPAHVFEAERLYGRAALSAYIEGQDGRLMRSMKSILGSSLLDQRTDIGAGRAVRYRDVVTAYLQHLKMRAEAAAGRPLTRVVLGRPVFFVDDDPARDRQAQDALDAAARQLGFGEVLFQYEPIAAALDFEARLPDGAPEQTVLVADIGGGTSDFSVVRVGPQRRLLADRRADVLANHGLHVAGTDFDRHVELAAILPLLGYRSLRPAKPGETPREVPSGVYFDLATWHLINTVYAPARVAELRGMRSWYARPEHHARLLATVEERLGHGLAAAAEQAKIDVALQGRADIDLHALEPGLASSLQPSQAAQALEADMARIVDAAQETVRRAGVATSSIDVLFFTGGSTGLQPLVDRIAAGFSAAQQVRGDRFASVAQGLGLHAQRVFGAQPIR
jgi:hypothetical chaperone protein